MELTLYLWPRGLFPRRIVYQLLLQGLASPVDILSGRSMVPNLDFNVSNLGASGFTSSKPSDPKPESFSSPCLRVRDASTSECRWIHESSAIAAYLADTFSGYAPVRGQSSLDRAAATDMVCLLDLLANDSKYYVKHAAPSSSSWSGLNNEQRSLAAATNAKNEMLQGLFKLQSWAQEGLERTGWLTPGIDRPGIVDASLAGMVRYLELVFELDLFGGDEFRPLREWWTRFRTVDWWREMEETGEVHPPMLRHGREGLEV